MTTVGPHFTRRLVKAVNDWQAGSIGKHGKAKAIVKAIAESPLDGYLTSCDTPLYRRSVLRKSAVTHLFFKFTVPEETSSWTTRLGVASRFKGGPPVPPDPGVIFSLTPKVGEVVLNLERLYEHPEFRKSADHWKAEGLDLSKGIDRYGDSQSEVVLTLDEVSHDSIYAFGSNSATSALETALGLPMLGASMLDANATGEAFNAVGLNLAQWRTGGSARRIYHAWIDRVTKRLEALPAPQPATPPLRPAVGGDDTCSPVASKS